LVKALEDAALAMASVYRSVGLPLPTTMPMAGDAARRRFADLLARYMPFDLVVEEHTVDGHEARVSKTSVCGSWGAVAGSLRYFADRFGIPRASIEGTQLTMDLLAQYAERHPPMLALDPERKQNPVLLRRRVTFHGFELSSEQEPLGRFPEALIQDIRHLLADAAARGQLRHPAVRRNQPVIDEIREIWRRLGGTFPRLGQAELTAWYAAQMHSAWDWEAVRALPLLMDRRTFVSEAQRAEARALPEAVEVRDRTVGLEYDVEERDGALTPVVRLRVPEKLARTLAPSEVPSLDRPVRYVVLRGQRGSVRADDLDTLQERLDDPYTDEERAAWQQAATQRREGRESGRHGARDGRSGPRGGGPRGGGPRGGGSGGRGGSGHGGSGRGGGPGGGGRGGRGGGRRRR
jgi:hypothetical protein